MKNILLIGLGGALGSIARYVCQRWINGLYPQSFPIGTFLVNITGCFLIGIFWGLGFRNAANQESWKLFLMTGLCGGFTTFSAFTLEGVGLLKDQKTGIFLVYTIASVLLGLVATFAGMKIARP